MGNAFVFEPQAAYASTAAQWAPASSPEPSDSHGGNLAHVVCLSATSCHAVGVNFDLSNVEHSLMQKYNGTAWSVVASQDPVGSGQVTLNNLDCISATFCQAVGSYRDGGMAEHALIYAYNGTAWSVATISEPVGSNSVTLGGVDCSSTTFCQAVGSYRDSGNVLHTLIYAYNGSTWSVVASSDPAGAAYSGLKKVACVSTTFCQAVGYYGDSGNNAHTQIQSYNGTAWSVATSSDPTNDSINSSLEDINCASATSCQAVGYYRAPDASWHTITKTYNGTVWNLATVTGPGSPDSGILTHIDCVSASFCQAVGSYYLSSVQKPLVHTYNGTTWSTTAIPDPSDFVNGFLNGVSCISTTACHIVGTYQDTNSDQRALIQSYDGTDWSIASGVDPVGTNFALLLDVDCASATFCQAVGVYRGSNVFASPLIEMYALIDAGGGSGSGSGSLSPITNSVLSTSTSTSRSTSYSGDDETASLLATAAEPTDGSSAADKDTTHSSQDKPTNTADTVTAQPPYNWWWVVIIIGVILVLVAIGFKAYKYLVNKHRDI